MTESIPPTAAERLHWDYDYTVPPRLGRRRETGEMEWRGGDRRVKIGQTGVLSRSTNREPN